MESGSDDAHAQDTLAAGADRGKVFNDPIHGHIELHPLMVRIIDTPQFQRLRYIKQLGAGYYVFPGACHNRFEHSIGVSHLAGELVEVLKKKQPELGITECDVLCVRIAGLCHDLGHGPFSHMFDGLFIPRVNPGSGWKHEKGSVDMFEHLLTENNLLKFFRLRLTDKDVVFIKEQIAGPLQSELASQARPSDWPYLGRPEEKSFLYEVVANKRNGIDVDKWDYFARDCHYLGMANNFDARRCMKFARVIDDGGRKQICTRDNEATNLYQMFHTRCFLHRRAYQHKTNTVIQLMFTEALVKANDHLLLPGKDGSTKKMSEAIHDMHAYTHLTDHTLLQILVSTDPNLEEAKELLRRVERRQLYKCIGRTKAIEKRYQLKKSERVDIPEQMVTQTEDLQQLKKEDIVAFIATFDYGKGDENPIDHVRFYRKDELKKAIKLEKDEVSLMLPEQFKEQYVWVYCKKDDKLSCKAARRYFLQWCSRKRLNPYPETGDEELVERSTREAATAATTESA